MRKLMMLVAMLALVLAVTVPALAQPHVPLAVSAAPQEAETGNVANEQGVVQYQTKTDDIDFTGSSITIDGASVTATCTQTIEQAAAAG